MPYGRGLTARGIRSLYVGVCVQLKLMTVVAAPYGSVVTQCMRPQPIDWPAPSASQSCHCVLVGLAR